MADKFALIICKNEEIYPGIGFFERTYSWEGNRRLPVLIDNYLGTTHELPWPLKKIDDDFWTSRSVYIRKDVNFWWVTSAIYAIKKKIQWINIRLILTAQVWGLVLVEPGVIPNWRDAIRAQRLARKMIKKLSR